MSEVVATSVALYRAKNAAAKARTEAEVRQRFWELRDAQKAWRASVARYTGEEAEFTLRDVDPTA